MTRKTNEPNYMPIEKNKTSDLIVSEIWKLITAGILKPGDKLPPERELKNKFNVSLATLREALQTLEAYGHITKKRGAEGGSFILDITPIKGIDLVFNYLKHHRLNLEDLHHARLSLDPILAEYAADHADEKEKLMLQDLIKTHTKDFMERGTSKCGWEFYLDLAKISRNQIYIIFQEVLIRLLLDFEFSNSISDLESTDEQHEYNEESYRAHKKIVEAIVENDAKKAKEEMIKHRLTWYEQLKALAGNRSHI